jgi:hypothetical protein
VHARLKLSADIIASGHKPSRTLTALNSGAQFLLIRAEHLRAHSGAVYTGCASLDNDLCVLQHESSAFHSTVLLWGFFVVTATAYIEVCVVVARVSDQAA